MLDRHLDELVARDLNTNPGLIEKDWHVTRAIGVLATLDHGAAVPAFGGGTSLSKGWQLIKRFGDRSYQSLARRARLLTSQCVLSSFRAFHHGGHRFDPTEAPSVQVRPE